MYLILKYPTLEINMHCLDFLVFGDSMLLTADDLKQNSIKFTWTYLKYHILTPWYYRYQATVRYIHNIKQQPLIGHRSINIFMTNT